MSNKCVFSKGVFGYCESDAKPECKSVGVNTVINMQNTTFYNAFDMECNSAQKNKTPHTIPSLVFASVNRTGKKSTPSVEKCTSTQNDVAETRTEYSSSGISYLSGLRKFCVNGCPLSPVTTSSTCKINNAHYIIPSVDNVTTKLGSSLLMPSNTACLKHNVRHELPSTSVDYSKFKKLYPDKDELPLLEKLECLTLNKNSDVTTTQRAVNKEKLLGCRKTANYARFEKLYPDEHALKLEELASNAKSNFITTPGLEKKVSSLRASPLRAYPTFEELYPEDHKFIMEELGLLSSDEESVKQVKKKKSGKRC